jgi:hypothetical protein
VHRPRCSALARELGRERGSGAGEGVEDQERQDGRQVQPTQRRDDAPEDVQIRVAYRAARHKQHFSFRSHTSDQSKLYVSSG